MYETIKGIWAKANELALGIRTQESDGGQSEPLCREQLGDRSRVKRSKHQDDNDYVAPDYWCVYKVARLLELKPNDIFYDIGCGMGRV